MTQEPALLGGRYELGPVLGRGGMAEVRRARDRRLGRGVAVKQLRVDLATDPTFQARFRREAQAAAGLNHPNIVSVYDTGEQVDPHTGVAVPYIVMELVEGMTLRDVLRDGGKILPERALELARGVLVALSYSHKHGIIHRDIKPANVMLTPTGHVKVMDFGIARAVADTSATMTQTAAVIGTAQYLSPEQARGETVDTRSDIYSLGCLLYELLTGRPPFEGDSPVSVAYQHVRMSPVPPSQLQPDISPPIDAIVLAALAKSPDDRYQTAQDMIDDISRVLSGQELTAVLPAARLLDDAAAPTAALAATPSLAPTPVDEPGDEEDEESPAPRRRRGLWVLMSVLGLLLVGLITGGIVYLSLPSQPTAVQTVKVPFVTTAKQADAERTLRAVQLVPSVERIEGPDDDSVGTVVKQTPFADEEVAAGSQVTIEVNVGPTKLTVPGDLVGRDKDAVKEALRRVGFTHVRLRAATSESGNAKTDEVVAVNPAEGAEAPADQLITVTFATGFAEVPNVMSLSEQDAKDKLTAEGFSAKVSYQASSQPAGTVIKQSPAAYRRTKTGTTVAITVAKARPPTPSPPPTTAAPSGGQTSAPATASTPPSAPPSGKASTASQPVQSASA